MKIIHIESGLGNQMLSYAEYLVIKKLNPSDKCYIETIVYDIPECNDVICQWYGYELKRVFGIQTPNIKEIFNSEEWGKIINSVKESKFWLDGWRYAPAIVSAFKKYGYEIENYIGDTPKYLPENNNNFLKKISNSHMGYDFKRWIRPVYKDRYRKKFDCTSKIFIKTEKSILAGQSLGLKNYGANLKFIEKEISEAFKFPPITDEKNNKILQIIDGTQSVSIHARRGDMLQSNGYCYKYGYFKRATNYIRRRVKKPVFLFFCDTDSIDWCRQNEKTFGIDLKKDDVYFVDWNSGLDYFKDIQLMSRCKHNIITNSSFGWWGTYLNHNPDKITISPNVWLGTNVHL